MPFPLTPVQRFFLLLGLCGALAFPVQAQVSASCTEERTAAESHYLEGRFSEAIDLVQACVRRGRLAAVNVIPVYRLLSLAYLQLEEIEQARQAVDDLLDRVPSYAPDPVQDPPSYVHLVTDVKDERQAARLAVEEEPDRTEEPPLAAEMLAAPVETQTPRTAPRGWGRRVRNAVVAAGGAVAVAVATALAFGGGQAP